jgi:hypothetical protein
MVELARLASASSPTESRRVDSIIDIMSEVAKEKCE